MKLYLQKLSITDGRLIYDMLQEIESNANGFYNTVKGMPYDDYKLWLNQNVNISSGIGLEDWMVPQTTYWMFVDEMPVGCGRIRHWLNESLEATGGHIGYAISCLQREKGYGNELLRLLIEECCEMGIECVQVGANKDNELNFNVSISIPGKSLAFIVLYTNIPINKMSIKTFIIYILMVTVLYRTYDGVAPSAFLDKYELNIIF